MSQTTIKPLSPIDVDTSKISFSKVINIPDIGFKYCKILYDGDEKLIVVIRGCTIKTFTKLENKSGKGKSKYQLFMSLNTSDKNKDEDENKDKYQFITMIKNIEKYLITQCAEKSNQWFDETIEEEDCAIMLKPTLSNNDYGYAISGILSNEFVCKDINRVNIEYDNLEDALQKNNVIDVCISFNRLKLGVDKYSLGFEINQINIKAIGKSKIYESNPITIETFDEKKISFGKLQQHEKGGKFIIPKYEGRPVSFQLKDINARIFLSKEGKYSMCINLKNKDFHDIIKKYDAIILQNSLQNIQEYYGKKNAKQVNSTFNKLESYSKSDQEKIKKGEKPAYEPSIWIKIWHSDEKGFDGKIINAETSKPITNAEDILNKSITISMIDFYSRHVWFGPKGTSINLSLNKCSVSYDAPVYDMDDVDDADENKQTKVEKTKSVKTESESESESEVENSDSD